MTNEKLNQIIDLQCKAFELLGKIEKANGGEKEMLQAEYDGIIEVLKVYSK